MSGLFGVRDGDPVQPHEVRAYDEHGNPVDVSSLPLVWRGNLLTGYYVDVTAAGEVVKR